MELSARVDPLVPADEKRNKPVIRGETNPSTMIFGKKKKIRVNVKLLAGLDQQEGYDATRGIQVEVPEKTKLKRLLKVIDLPVNQPVSFIVNGEKAKPGDRLAEGDEVFCFLPFAGG